jgi:hypothetical protein
MRQEGPSLPEGIRDGNPVKVAGQELQGGEHPRTAHGPAVAGDGQLRFEGGQSPH